MSPTNETLVGFVVDVRGDGLTANLLADEQESTPKVTVGDEDILVGQLGSYVSVNQGPIKILCLVTRITEQEKLADPNAATPAAPVVTYALRTIGLIPIGTVTSVGQFERGVSTYPTTGAEVHVVSATELATLFSKFREQGYQVGSRSGPHSLDRKSLMISEIFCGIFPLSERSRRWQNVLDGITHQRLKPKWPWPPSEGIGPWQN